MISMLRGTVIQHEAPTLILDVNGVGYELHCTQSLWDKAVQGTEMEIVTFTFVREDRLELFGFASALEKKLFTQFLNVPGVGPRIAVQICSVPTGVLVHAVENEDTRALAALKGVGKKMAEKLLLELSGLAEKGMLSLANGDRVVLPAEADDDALDALIHLGYDRRSILTKLKELPDDLHTTEERVKRVLQML